MKKWLLVVCLLATTVAAAYGEKKNHEYQTGKLINISTDERLIEGTTHRSAIFTIQIGDLVYTARGVHVRARGGDVGKGLIVGDPVQAFDDGDHLFVLLPDGKELKTKIIKKTRAQ
jgi:methionine aminopeptidase